MDFIDEQDDVATRADFFQHLLQTLFEVTAIATTRHEGAEVERVELLVRERLRDVVADDALSKALNDGGLADAWFANEHRIVLRAARKNLHDAFHLALTSDDGIEFLVACKLREVATELVEDLTATLLGGCVLCPDWFTLAFTGGTLVAAQQLDDLLAHT